VKEVTRAPGKEQFVYRAKASPRDPKNLAARFLLERGG
jgi:hypothetical protein